METLTDEQELEKIKQEIEVRKQQMQVANEQASHETADVLAVVSQEESDLIQSDEVKKASRLVAEERTKSVLSAEASRIRRTNIETAEHEFENDTRQLRLDHLKAELQLEHKYNMNAIEQDAKHKRMLATRKKLVEQYGYLYDCKPENCYTCYDEDNKPYQVPKDFSYSPTINKIRQFGRNISKLDRPILQVMKWAIIIGIGVFAYFMLRK